MDTDTIPVDLDLDETGTLCHLLMADKDFRLFLLTGEVEEDTKSILITPEVVRAVMNRRLALYKKLTLANDKLMGKV